MNLLPITCVNHIMRYLADMENKKYIPVFEETGKINWKINANLYKNLTKIINHKKENPPIQLQYRIVNTSHGSEGQPKIFTSVVLPERNNEYKLNYMCSIDNATYIEKVIITEKENQPGRWNGNYHRPYHPVKSERYKFILWMDEDEIMIHTSIQFQHQQQEEQEQHEPEDMTDEEMMEDDASGTEDEDAANDETFNLSEEDMAAFEQDFVFQYVPM